VNLQTNAMTMAPYRYVIPKFPEDTVVIRSDHANAKAFEFMDAEYNQWPMHGEAVANAGPFYMQHGCWRVEVEPTEKKKTNFFLHVMLPCDKNTLTESQSALKRKVKLTENGDSINLEIEGKAKNFQIIFKKNISDVIINASEK